MGGLSADLEGSVNALPGILQLWCRRSRPARLAPDAALSLAMEMPLEKSGQSLSVLLPILPADGGGRLRSFPSSRRTRRGSSGALALAAICDGKAEFGKTPFADRTRRQGPRGAGRRNAPVLPSSLWLWLRSLPVPRHRSAAPKNWRSSARPQHDRFRVACGDGVYSFSGTPLAANSTPAPSRAPTSF
jgi:hypothetical protein